MSLFGCELGDIIDGFLPMVLKHIDLRQEPGVLVGCDNLAASGHLVDRTGSDCSTDLLLSPVLKLSQFPQASLQFSYLDVDTGEGLLKMVSHCDYGKILG